MKKLLAALFVSTLITPIAQANELCNNVHTMATSIMDARQKGVPLKTMVDIINQNYSSEVRVLVIKLAVDAYKYPQYSVENNQQKQINEFGNLYYGECIKQVMGEE